MDKSNKTELINFFFKWYFQVGFIVSLIRFWMNESTVFFDKKKCVRH